jgi:hypothetical protein
MLIFRRVSVIGRVPTKTPFASAVGKQPEWATSVGCRHTRAEAPSEKDVRRRVDIHPTRGDSSWAPQHGFQNADRRAAAHLISTTAAKRIAITTGPAENRNNRQGLTRARASYCPIDTDSL